MNDRLGRLAMGIGDELNDLDRIVGRIGEGWRKAQHSDVMSSLEKVRDGDRH